MFSNNSRISMRQTFRLFAFDFLGMSSLVVPPFLAKGAGTAGVWCIFSGGILGAVYLLLLGCAKKKMGMGLDVYLRTNKRTWVRKAFSVWLALHCLFTAGFCGYVFSTLMSRTLVQQKSFPLVAGIIVLISAYAILGGIESRARVYEVLFWFVVIPLLIMLLTAAGDVNPHLYDSFFQTDMRSFLKGSYLVFLFSQAAFFVLFFPDYVSPQKMKKPLTRAVAFAMAAAWLVLLVIYLILEGTFGNEALAQMDFPVITLMSTIRLSGDFVKRLDALMLAVWYFSLYAVLNMHMFYGMQMFRQTFSVKKEKYAAAFCAPAVYLLTVLFYCQPALLRTGFFGYIRYAGAPIMILIPLWIIGGRRHDEKKMVADSSDPASAVGRMQG